MISDFSQQGIEVAASGNVALLLNDVTIRNTNVAGITLATSAAQVHATLNNVRINGTNVGLLAANRVRATVVNAMLGHNPIGIQTSGVDNIVIAENVMISSGGTGILGSAGSTIRVSNSVISQNGTGLNANGGQIVSMSGNSVTGNTLDGAFTSTVAKQ